MKFKVTKASNSNFEREVEINTLEELKQLQYEYKNPKKEHPDDVDYVFLDPEIVVDFDTMTITIYDYYLE